MPVLYASEWFSTIFVYSFPVPVVVRIWDIFLAEGAEYLFKVALAILSLSHDELMSMNFEQTVKYLKAKEKPFGADEIIRVAEDMWCVDKEALEALEDKFKNPKTSIFRIELL